MNLSLKNILKQSDVLFISEYDEDYKKIESILKIFYNKVLHTNSIKYAIELYEKNFPTTIIIDINLKENNGISFVKDLRKKNKYVSIIVITYNKELENLLDAIKLNLIDYILKPFDVNKFIFALNQCAKQILNSGDIKTVIKNEIRYNYLEKTIINLNKKESLTKNESRLIELFLNHKNKFVSNEDIKKHIWSQKEVTESAFKSLVSRLSKKLGNDAITNSFGIGYGIFD